ncbi:MAG: 3-deoxy-7-phosphoheptulonate synthase [Fusobacterium sp.]|uniref:3-deoxy-7-phosphoheptulonate synthase n=1 Tax=Fusobacterium sp. TaxID=68766 RepID=UPI0026DACF01|nr:3-deoxy-7-phosphoheptulonate synthase [Fusobacterium sp.]MDO4689915.1 3-deoxy-7-phosphoheptulonate synthase [Fusobacterium sp.]
MYIELKIGTSFVELTEILNFLDKYKIKYFCIKDKNIDKIALIYIPENFDMSLLKNFNKILRIHKINKAYKFVSREFKTEDSEIEIKGHKIGAKNFLYMAGPCSVENREMLAKIAKKARENGALALRGGAYKPRTSPYDFQGLGEEALKYLREIADENNMLVVTEAMDTENLNLVVKYTDIIQIGARNMQNFSLLKKLGNIDKPVLLKRGLSATINEFLMSAEYIIAHGNKNVILCERGIRTFETATRNTLDINAIALIRQESHLPIIVDASHGTGKRSIVESITLAGVIAGANGAMVEFHENPDCALSDGPQSLNFEMFDRLSKKLKKTLEFREELNKL